MIAGAAFGYAQAIIFWVFALLFYVGAILVDDGTVEYDNFFTAMFAVIFGAFGVGQVLRESIVQCSVPNMPTWYGKIGAMVGSGLPGRYLCVA